MKIKAKEKENHYSRGVFSVFPTKKSHIIYGKIETRRLLCFSLMIFFSCLVVGVVKLWWVGCFFVVVYLFGSLVGMFVKSKSLSLVGLFMSSFLLVASLLIAQRGLFLVGDVTDSRMDVAISSPQELLIVGYDKKGVYRVVIDEKEYRYYSDKEYQIHDIVWSVFDVARVRDDPSLSSLSFLSRDDRYWNRSLLSMDGYQLFDFSRWMQGQGLSGVLYEQQGVVVGQVDNMGWLQSWRLYVRENIISLAIEEHYRALLLGVVMGDVSLMTADQYTYYIDTGIVHVVAASGANIAMFVLCFMILLFWVPYYTRLRCLGVLVAGYVMMVGDDSSMIRAGIMGGLSLMVGCLGRYVSLKRLLKLTWIAMLLWNPFYLVSDWGFILSFSALGGIIISQVYLHHLGGVRRLISMYCLPALLVFVVLFPLLLLLGGVGIGSVMVNILIAPFVSFLMFVGMVVAMVGDIRGLGLVVVFLSDVIYFIIEQFTWGKIVLVQRSYVWVLFMIWWGSMVWYYYAHKD